jgi:hypothetical protein
MMSSDSSPMSSSGQVSTCRYCRSYQVEGRRGGHCSKLNVNVQSRWSACSLAEPTFMRKLVPESGFAAEVLAVEALLTDSLAPAIETKPMTADGMTVLFQSID